jgi:hypothetical protein
MRVEFVGVGHPKQIGKSLKRALAARGTDIGLRTCEEIFAKMTGYANWHELRIVALRNDTRFIKDEEAGEMIAAARRAQFVVKLAEHAGVSLPVAEAVVDAVRPTGMRVKREAPEASTAPHGS